MRIALSWGMRKFLWVLILKWLGPELKAYADQFQKSHYLELKKEKEEEKTYVSYPKGQKVILRSDVLELVLVSISLLILSPFLLAAFVIFNLCIFYYELGPWWKELSAKFTGSKSLVQIWERNKSQELTVVDPFGNPWTFDCHNDYEPKNQVRLIRHRRRYSESYLFDSRVRRWRVKGSV